MKYTDEDTAIMLRILKNPTLSAAALPIFQTENEYIAARDYQKMVDIERRRMQAALDIRSIQAFGSPGHYHMHKGKRIERAE